MNHVKHICITEEENGQRLDNFLMRQLKGVPKSYIYRIIRSGEVRVNKKRAKPTTRVIHNDIIRIPPTRSTQPKSFGISASLADLLLKSILHEDKDLLVMNKPAGLAVHGGSGETLGLIEAMRTLRTDLHYLVLVHRLDKETSGCLLLAKKRSILRELQALLREKTMVKTYWALLTNPWRDKKIMTINAPLEKNILLSGERMVKLSEQGKPSETRFTLMENFSHACLVQAQPLTGRTHQIRVHSASIHHPIIGDKKYGEKKPHPTLNRLPNHLFLHALSINFRLRDKQHSYQAPLDEKFNLALKLLRSVDKASKTPTCRGLSAASTRSLDTADKPRDVDTLMKRKKPHD